MTVGYKQIKCNIIPDIFSNNNISERKAIIQVYIPDNAIIVQPNWDDEFGECIKCE